MTDDRLPIDASTRPDDAARAVRAWCHEHIPRSWREAAERGGAAGIRTVRSRADYEAWYPRFGASGLVAATWPADYGGLDATPEAARAIEAELAPYNLGRLNPLGLNLAAPALFAHGTEEQRRRFLPPIVAAEEIWCQLFSEPGAGSDLASLSTKAIRHGDEWVVTGQKVWTTWAHEADYGVLLARTDPDAPKRKGITYFLVDLHAPGVDVRPLRHLTGEIDFNEVFLDEVRIPDNRRVGAVGHGWTVANATLSGERQMVAGAGSGGVDRIGGSGVERLVRLARERSTNGLVGGWSDPTVRQRLVALWSQEQIRRWTNLRVRAGRQANRPLGPESSIGKVVQGSLNQDVQVAAVDLLGPGAMAWECSPSDDRPREDAGSRQNAMRTDPLAYGKSLPFEVHGMLRSRANTIEGGTTEVNKNILAERVLGLPREPDQWHGHPWSEVPR